MTRDRGILRFLTLCGALALAPVSRGGWQCASVKNLRPCVDVAAAVGAELFLIDGPLWDHSRPRAAERAWTWPPRRTGRRAFKATSLPRRSKRWSDTVLIPLGVSEASNARER